MSTNRDHDSLIRTKILDINASFMGIKIDQLMETAGENIAEELTSHYGKSKSIAFLCGRGGNGGNGISAARHLLIKGYSGEITVYLAGRQNKFSSPAAASHWQMLRDYSDKFGPENLVILTDATKDQIENHQIIVECLVGTGIRGKFKKRFRDIIKRCTHFNQTMVAIDNPVPGYKWDLSLSIMYPKTPDSVVVDIGMPDEVVSSTGPGHVAVLNHLNTTSHKSKNGKVLIITGQYDPKLDLELFLNLTAANTGEVYWYDYSGGADIKPSSNISLVSESELEVKVIASDCIVVGPGWRESLVSQAIFDSITERFPDKKIIITDAAHQLVKDAEKNWNHNILFLTTHQNLQSLLPGNHMSSMLEGKLKRFCAERQCYINLQGTSSMIFGRNSFSEQPDLKFTRIPISHMNPEQAKIILSALTAGFASRNDLWLSALAADFVTRFYDSNLQNSTASISKIKDLVTYLSDF